MISCLNGYLEQVGGLLATAGRAVFQGTKPQIKGFHNLGLTGAATIEVRVRPYSEGSYSHGAGLVSYGYGPDLNSGIFEVLMLGTALFVRVYLTSGPVYMQVGSLPLNLWSHVAAVFDGQTIRLYVNAQPVGSTAAAGAFIAQSAGERMALGNRAIYIESSENASVFKGEMDEARIWSIARTQEEIEESMNQSLKEPQTGLAGLWPLDVEPEAGTVPDYSGNGRTLTPQEVTFVAF